MIRLRIFIGSVFASQRRLFHQIRFKLRQYEGRSVPSYRAGKFSNAYVEASQRDFHFRRGQREIPLPARRKTASSPLVNLNIQLASSNFTLSGGNHAKCSANPLPRGLRGHNSSRNKSDFAMTSCGECGRRTGELG